MKFVSNFYRSKEASICACHDAMKIQEVASCHALAAANLMLIRYVYPGPRILKKNSHIDACVHAVEGHICIKFMHVILPYLHALPLHFASIKGGRATSRPSSTWSAPPFIKPDCTESNKSRQTTSSSMTISLLIILQSDWSVSVKYAFNQLQIRFRPGSPKRFLFLSCLSLPILPMGSQVITHARLCAGVGRCPDRLRPLPLSGLCAAPSLHAPSQSSAAGDSLGHS
jgi:hypothetical protein